MSFKFNPFTGTFDQVQDIVGNWTTDNFSGDGSTTGFTLSVTPASEDNVFVWIDGVYQQRNTFSVSGTTLTFSTAPPSGSNNIEVSSGTAVSIGTPGDGTITRAKLASGAVAERNIATKTSAYTATSSDDILLCNTSSAGFTITLPAASGVTGQELLIKKIGSDYNNLTIDGDGTETIDGATTYVLYLPNEWVKIVSDGSNWQVIDEHWEPDNCYVYLSSQMTGLTSATTVAFDTERYDDNGSHSSGTFTTKAAGKYVISSGVSLAALDGATDAFFYIKVGAANYSQVYCGATSSAAFMAGTGSVSADVAEGETFTVVASGDASFTVDGSARSWLSVTRVSR